MKAQISTHQHWKQFLLTPIIVFDIEKYSNTLFIGWLFWRIKPGAKSTNMD